MKRILIDGGYIEGGVYYFNLTDHLGNNRVIANASGTPIFNLTFAAAWGFDISHGVTGTVGNYVGDDKPTGASLTGSSWNVNGGMGGVSFGTSSDIVQYNPVEIGKTGSYKYDEKVGTNWNMRSEGYSFGSKSFISGTAQRAYTTPPLFLYKTSK